MKRVLLLGDSIRMGYDSMVKELLSDKYEVFFPEDNGRFSSYTLWQMNQCFKNEGSFDLVHWNNGYWDMNPEYSERYELFFDPIHLNPQGQKVASDKIIELFECDL
jgi:lysophospholipase L1-like esterase